MNLMVGDISSLEFFCISALASTMYPPPYPDPYSYPSPPPSANQNSPEDYVNAHNKARSEVGVGPVSWDPKLAAYARNYANQRAGNCQLVHSGGPYGENIASGSGEFMNGAKAVDLWVGEKADYDYNTNTCASGRVCGHYTQVVWRDTARIGCARTRCGHYNGNGWFTVVCEYDPPGNIIGQRPY